jgi:plastocyanin
LAATAGAVACCLAIPATSSAATRDVYMGTPPKYQKTLNQTYQSDANAYFPSKTTIHVGDTVRFNAVGFHNLSLPKKGGSPTPAVVPTGQTYTGEKDAAGADFWFNGQPSFGFNPALTPPSPALFGKSVTYNGSAAVDSGLPLADKPKPVKVKFTKTGTFTYYCTIHPGMKGQVKVVAKRSSAPSSKAQAAAIAKQAKQAISIAKGLAKRKAPALGITVGVAGSHGVERYAFSPDKRTVKVGDTLTFTMGSQSLELHTATTGPGDPDHADTYIGKLAASFESPVFPGYGIYPSDPPSKGNATLTPTSHGNGFWNSGGLNNNNNDPLPNSNSVLFGAPGTYTFICLVHPFMKATVTVTP